MRYVHNSRRGRRRNIHRRRADRSARNNPDRMVLRGVDGGALDAGDVDIDIYDSETSGISGVLGVDEPEYGGGATVT